MFSPQPPGTIPLTITYPDSLPRQSLPSTQLQFPHISQRLQFYLQLRFLHWASDLYPLFLWCHHLNAAKHLQTNRWRTEIMVSPLSSPEPNLFYCFLSQWIVLALIWARNQPVKWLSFFSPYLIYNIILLVLSSNYILNPFSSLILNPNFSSFCSCKLLFMHSLCFCSRFSYLHTLV